MRRESVRTQVSCCAAREYGYRDFSDAETEVVRCRTLARLIAKICDTADDRFWETLSAALRSPQAQGLESLLDVGALPSILRITAIRHSRL